MTQTLLVKLPPPPGCLSPNKKGRALHWAEKGRAVKRARLDAGLTAMVAIREQGVRVPFKQATLQGRWWFAVKRYRDDDNYNSWCKAYRDGLADAGIVKNDKDFTWLPPVILVDPTLKRPVLEIVVTEIQKDQ